MGRSGVHKVGGGLDDMRGELRRIGKVITKRKVYERVGRKLQRRAEDVLRNPSSFDFGTEPKWRARKAAIHGPWYAQRPLLTPTGTLGPSLYEEGHPEGEFRATDDALHLGSKVSIAQDLLERGGVNPLGERFPARNPFRKIPRDEVEAMIRDVQEPILRSTVRVGSVS